MQNHITSLANRKAPAAKVSSAKVQYSVPFADRLKEYSDRANQPKESGAASSKILVGEISRSHQTVSELLMHHSQLKSKTWDILSARKNVNKDYRTLTPGTKIYYSSADASLSWVAAEQSNRSSTEPQSPMHHTVSTSGILPENSAAEPAAEAIQLGVIGTTSPTVSHLLHAHSAFKNETWKILANSVNSSKDFTNLPVGVSVQINSTTREIRWQSTENISITETAQIGNETKQAKAAMTVTAKAVTDPISLASAGAEPVLLGSIDNQNPTVSHLLRQNPELADRLWAVLGNSANQGKPFHEIASGTQIYLHPESQEIIWGQPEGSRQQVAQTIAAAHLPVKNIQDTLAVTPKNSKNTPAADLTEAVRPYLGSSYKELNCYELLVKGLERMDIPYTGKGGLLSKLTQMAREKGLPANAFMNGEGIVKAAGSLVLSKSYPKTSNWKREAEQLYKEMEPLLDKGQILSFSTKKRGHTGIISQHHSEWTFINSGRLDNSLTKNSPSNGVGEEVLKKEIRNWFKLANSSREPLMVTLGSIGHDKVVTAFNQSSESSKKVSLLSADYAQKTPPVALHL